MQKRNKTKHNQTKKHKYHSSLILNRYVIKNIEVIKFKDVFNPYFIEHTRKINFHTVCITLKPHLDESSIKHEISLSNYVTYKKESEHYTTFTTYSASDFLHRVISIYFRHRCSPKIFPEIEINFISDPKDIT